MATEDSTRGKRRRGVCLPSCFRPSPTSDAVEVKAGTSRWWRQLGAKQKTVPVNAVVDPPLPASAMDAQLVLPSAKRSFLLHWFRKKQGKRMKGPIPTNHTQHQPQSQHPASSRSHTTSRTRVHQVMSRSRTRPEPAPLYRIHDRAQTATQTIHLGSPEPDNHCAFESLVGLSVVVVVLTMLLVCGRMGAVMFVCTWMYLLPHITVTSRIDGSRTGKKEGKELDMDSAEYKKMVVLKGLLERDGRRPSLTKLAAAH